MSQINCSDCPHRFMCYELGLIFDVTTLFYKREFILGLECHCPMSIPNFKQMVTEWEKVEKARRVAEHIRQDWKGKWLWVSS